MFKPLVAWYMTIWLVIAIFVIPFQTCDVLLHVKQCGYIRGTRSRSEEGRPFYAFRGIPYAEPPVQALRFKPPIPKEPWEHTLDATKDGQACAQMLNNGSVHGKEDCLTLNVYTPKLQSNASKVRVDFNKAVMVFIHGGSFMIYDGTSASFPPERLMDSDIVLVTMNYRLNALGFLGTEDDSSPGNYGLLDQTLALRWVNENIQAFGGNPNAVTIFGQSAGAASVSYHLRSSLSKGLFHRAIAMSGSSLCPWAFENKPLRWAQYLAKEIDCPVESTQAMLTCFRTKPVEDLLKPISLTPIPFPPTLDGHFLVAHPSDVSNTRENLNHVPVMTGVTEEEGVGDVWELIKSKWNTSATPNELTDFVLTYTTKGNPKLITMIKDRYLATVNQQSKYQVARTLMKAYSDGAFIMPHYAEVNFLSKAGLTVYAYSYDYHAENIYEKIDSARLNITHAVSHGEDLFMLFNKNWTDGKWKRRLNRNDRKMVKFMTRLWSNFAKTGNPSLAYKFLANWKPSSPEHLNILHINDPVTVQDHDINSNKLFQFWNKDVVAVLSSSSDIP